jgi:hypothetical protein
MKRWNEIEPSIIRSLNDPDLNRARQAADTLGKYGGPEAEKAMWTRLQSFHEQWVEREEDLANRANMPRNALDATSFQFGLVEALGRARGWLLTDEQVTELEHLTLGQERENVKGMRWKSPVELTVSGFADAGVSTRIGPSVVNDLAALRGKLAQFPPGTRFQLITFSETARIKPVKQAIYETAAEHGLTIQEP